MHFLNELKKSKAGGCTVYVNKEKMSSGIEADGWERSPLFCKQVSLNSFYSLANRVRDEKQTRELYV